MNVHKVIHDKRRALVAAACIAVCSVSGAFAQSPPVFAPGDILVSRTTYTGTASTVPFPGLLPNNAASVADGSFPNVFNNETPDGSFGVTSPFFIDRMTITGGWISTIPVSSVVFNQRNVNVATSFPSKSELGLSLTPDDGGITFMAYGSAANALDVSNANTPGHVDITNPVNGQGILINQRDIIELSASGAVQVTTTNAYSGNNGRNVVLGSNGNYFTAGNAGNNGKSVTFKSGVTLTSGSAAVGVPTTANLFVGTPFSGAQIPAGAYITSITGATAFTISAPATGAASGNYVANAGAVELAGISFLSGASTIAVTDTSKLVPGMPLAGTGLTGAHILSVTDATHFVASAPASANSDANGYTASVSNSMLSDDTGVQTIQKSVNDTAGTGTGILDAMTNSTVVGKVNGVYGSATGYQRGFSMTQIGDPADKSGKDDNFRGIVSYKDTLYVTKGSGGNGLDAVYQVNPNGGAYVPPGSSAGLPASANASAASINPLPGWPLTSTGANEGCATAKPPCSPVPTVYHPFGIWFANDTTLYVADEGLPGVGNAAAGGLQKWMYNAGTSQWELKYTLATSTISSYTVNGIGPLQAAGLRNIAGIDNGDGTVTILGITSTTGQTLNDEGADPNQLVSITDSLAATTLPSESFTVVETAAYGDALRGVAYVPGGSLSSLVGELFAAGMIDNAGVANALTSKSDAAASQTAQGNTTAAKNQLNAFINQLNAQVGQHLTQQAYDLLKAAALFYISRLP
ncbi:MAG TPA: hypothetical protein VKB79_26405 [Bryobacteraceae bacterium]|nr:hypothetical protein [Bryobacteraceae bacterium]